MYQHFDIDSFIKKHITHRKESLFAADLEHFKSAMEKAIKGKSILVIGGAGTIGSSFIKTLLKYKPGKLVVVDINENALTELVRDCRSRKDISLPEDFKSYPVNFGDKVFTKIFMQDAPFDIVANFAAHKHVRSEKDIYSIEAMIENNVLKAKVLLDLLVQNPPKHFFCVSTDKAANPVSIMGASKKLMEEVILAYSSVIPITTARFANVAFSNGSLLAGFLERMLKKQPLSSPNNVKRFFVSPDESGEICLMACVLGNSGDIYFPKLNEDQMVNFGDIGLNFIKENGFEPQVWNTEEDAKENVGEALKNNKYPILLFGSDTSGEKLYEEFYTDTEELDMEKYSSLGIIKNSPKRTKDELDQIIIQLENLFTNKVKKKDIINLLNILLPGFHHIETGTNLDQKM